MDKKLIIELLQHGERTTLECKKAENKLPNSLWETYSAFANTYGGSILLGVAENMKEQNRAKQFTILGVQDAVKLQGDLWNLLNNKEKVNEIMLRMIGLGENIGSGFPSILKAWQNEHWERPLLTEQPELLQVKLSLKIKDYGQNVTKDVTKDDIKKSSDYQQNDIENNINNVTRNDIKDDINVTKDVTKELSKRQLNMLEMIREDNLVTTFDLSQMLGVTRMTIQRDLKALREKGLITRKGSRSNGEWIVL